MPHVISVSGVERFGAGFKTNIAFDDHPSEEDAAHSYSMVSIDAVAKWMKANNFVEKILEF